MRSEKEIKERIDLYVAQNDGFMKDLETIKDYTVRETYRSWIKRNLEKIEELSWVAELSYGFNFNGKREW